MLREQELHQQLLLRGAEAPYLHLLLQTQDMFRKRDRAVSLRGMAASMQARAYSALTIETNYADPRLFFLATFVFLHLSQQLLV